MKGAKSLILALVLLLAFNCIFTVAAVDYDVNKDQQFNVSDVTALQMHLAKHDVDVDLFDVDADQKITIKDATAMQRLLAEIEVPSSTNDGGIGKDENEVDDDFFTEPETQEPVGDGGIGTDSNETNDDFFQE